MSKRVARKTMTFYIKNSRDEFVPIKIDKILNEDINDHLIIARVGSDENPARMSDVDLAEVMFRDSSVLKALNNVSIIVTPYQIDVDLIDYNELDNKKLSIQVSSGDDITILDTATKIMYRRLKKHYGDVVIMPSPLTLKDYRQVQDTLKRCKMRKNRRVRSKSK